MLSALIGLAGFAGAVLSLLVIVVQTIRRKPKGNALLAFGVCSVLFVFALVASSFTSPPSSTGSEAPTDAKETAMEDEEVSAEGDEAEDDDGGGATIEPSNEAASAVPLLEEGDFTPVLYEKDKAINQFLVDYNSITSSPATDISRGNIDSKCSFLTYDFYVEVGNYRATAGYMEVSIIGNKDAHVPEMRDAFHDVIKALDQNLSDEEIYAFFDERTVEGNAAYGAPLGEVTCSVHLTGNFGDVGRIDIYK